MSNPRTPADATTVDMQETDTDWQFLPRRGCCADCDDFLDDIAAFRTQLWPRRSRTEYRRRVRHRRRRR